MRISGKGKLDSEWGNGPRYKQAELDALNFIKLQPLWKDMTCAVGSSSSRTDGLWIKGESLKFLTEVKSRDTFGKNSSLEFTWDNLLNKYQGKYLISQGKIDENVEVAKFHGIPFYLIINFMVESKLLFVPVSDLDGNMIVDYSVKELFTQGTSNGGRKKDKVYHLDVSTSPDSRWMSMKKNKNSINDIEMSREITTHHLVESP